MNHDICRIVMVRAIEGQLVVRYLGFALGRGDTGTNLFANVKCRHCVWLVDVGQGERKCGGAEIEGSRFITWLWVFTQRRDRTCIAQRLTMFPYIPDEAPIHVGLSQPGSTVT